jgi:hypothetical protein
MKPPSTPPSHRGRKNIIQLHRRYRFLNWLQAPFKFGFWEIEQRKNRLELQLLRLQSHYQGADDGH